MLMLFFKHMNMMNELYRSYSKSLRYFGSSPVPVLDQKHNTKITFKSHTIYVMQTILDQKHRTICNLKWITKFYESFSNPTPKLEKSEKINILKYTKTIFVDSNFFLVFSHNIELGNIVRIKEIYRVVCI